MSCVICDQSKTQFSCGICEKPVCKNCITVLQKEDFRFHPKPPRLLQAGTYCSSCYDSKLAAEMEKYNEIAKESLDVTLVRKSFKGLLPILQKAKAPTIVKRHADKQEATLHLAFLAKWNGYNSVIQFNEESEKKRDYGFEKKIWQASGLFVNLDMKRFRPEQD